MDINIKLIHGRLNKGNEKESAARRKDDRTLDNQGATGVSELTPRFGAHTCSTSGHEQPRIPRSSVEQSAPRHQMRPAPAARQLPSSRSRQLTARSHTSDLDDSDWARFYDLYRKHSSTFTKKFVENGIKNALIKALNENRVLLKTVKDISDITTLTGDQKKALSEVTTQYYLLKHENSSSKAVTHAVTSPVSSAAGRSSQGKALFHAPGRSQQAFEGDKTGRALSDDPQPLRSMLTGLGIAQAKIDQIVAIKPDLMKAVALDYTLKYEIGLNDHETSLVLACLSPLEEIDSLMNARQKAGMEDQAKRAEQLALAKKAKDKDEEIKRFDYENNLSLAIEFSRRNIMKPEYNVLAIGSQIDDRTGRTFDKRRTIFADAEGHSDLNGDIYTTVDDIPTSKKFKEVHFTGLPGVIFNDAAANRRLFQKLNGLMKDGGKIFVRFGFNDQGYNNQKFVDDILKPSGFGQFDFLRVSLPVSGVRLSARKMEAMRTPSPIEAESPSFNTPFAASGSLPELSVEALQLPQQRSVQVPVPRVKNKATDQDINDITEQIKKEYVGLDDETIRAIKENIRFIKLDQDEIDNAAAGGRTLLDKILLECQILESSTPPRTPSPETVKVPFLAAGTSQPPGLVDVGDAALQPARNVTHAHGNVAFRVRAGIQARNNNCGPASFFVSISHNGLLDKLIEDAENKARFYTSGDMGRALSLTELVNILKRLNIGGDLGKYIPNDNLDDIRLRYGLRAVKLKHDAVVDALNKNGQIVNFTAESEFNRGPDLNETTRQTSISLRMEAASDHGVSRAVVVALPSPSLGYMRVKGINLTVGQLLTQTELSDLEFVPLGEILEPIEFIPPILEEIYGYLNTEAGPLHSLSQLESSTMSLKQKVSMVDMQNDRKTLDVRSTPSRNFNHKIDDEVIPGDWMLNERGTVKQPHLYQRNLTGKIIEHYYKNGVLRLKLTRELHHRNQSETRKVFEFFDHLGHPSRKIVVEMEEHFLTGASFIRAKESEFVNSNGQTMSVEQRMVGYARDRPMNGDIKRHVMRRAGNFEELIDIFIDSWTARFQNSVESARRALLPDGENSPEVIFMTIPNEGKDNRCNFDWQKDVGIPMLGSERRIPYEVSAVMAIEGSHYLSWRKDQDNGLIHFADSMGDVDDHNVTIPVVVTMPDQDTEAALQAAHDNIKGAKNYYKNAKDRLKVLGEQVALVILKRK